MRCCSLALLHAIDTAAHVAPRTASLTAALALAGAIAIQAMLGILTLLHHAPIALALAHQAMAILVLAASVAHAQRIAARQGAVPAGAFAPAR